MSDDTRSAALRFIAWARVWSPLASIDLRSEAWEALALPDTFTTCEPDYWSTFHVGDPLPKAPLVLHVALRMDGGHAREEWMRVLQFLGLHCQEDTSLPPDHLAVSCEALAAAVDREDAVMVSELRDRYLLPWCNQSRKSIGDEFEGMRTLVAYFEQDLRSLGIPSAE